MERKTVTSCNCVDRLQMIVVAKNLSVLQLFISRMPKMCAILQLVSAPLNPIPIAEHFRRSLKVKHKENRESDPTPSLVATPALSDKRLMTCH